MKPFKLLSILGVSIIALLFVFDQGSAYNGEIPEDHLAEHENESIIMEMDKEAQMEHRLKFCRIQKKIRHFQFNGMASMAWSSLHTIA